MDVKRVEVPVERHVVRKVVVEKPVVVMPGQAVKEVIKERTVVVENVLVKQVVKEVVIDVV